MKDTVRMSEPERRMLRRTDWAFVHQHAHEGLRMNVSAGGNVGERLMAVGARNYGQIREEALDWLGGSRSQASGLMTGHPPFPGHASAVADRAQSGDGAKAGLHG